jgi:hypothetical protein
MRKLEFIISGDCVHCGTAEARKVQTTKIYSHKTYGPAYAYELGIAIFENRLVWIAGPFLASVHDITMFCNEDDPENSLKAQILEGKRIIADAGYKGEAPGIVSISRPSDSKEVCTFKNRVRARHESFNDRIKSFRILDERFCHGKALHRQVFESVCVLVQFDMENGHPLMEI